MSPFKEIWKTVRMYIFMRLLIHDRKFWRNFHAELRVIKHDQAERLDRLRNPGNYVLK